MPPQHDVVTRGKTLDHAEHPVRAKDRLRLAGLLAPGSARPLRLPSQMSGQWHMERPLTGHSCGDSRGLQGFSLIPRSLLIPSLGTKRAIPLFQAGDCRKPSLLHAQGRHQCYQRMSQAMQEAEDDRMPPANCVRPAAVRRAGSPVALSAHVQLMCGCPITPGGRWDAADYDVSVDIHHEDQPVERIARTLSRRLDAACPWQRSAGHYRPKPGDWKCRCPAKADCR